MKLLNKIQQELKAPKNQRNEFGGFNYRSCEDILEAVKPLLGHTGTLILSDEIKMIGDRYYVEATATLYNDGKVEGSAKASAREKQERPKFDDAQLTGGASSYARKYALNGLFLIDDTKDADSDEKPSESLKTVPQRTKRPDRNIDVKKRMVELTEQLGHKFDKATFPDLIKKLTDLELVEEAYSEIVERLRDKVEEQAIKGHRV